MVRPLFKKPEDEMKEMVDRRVKEALDKKELERKELENKDKLAGTGGVSDTGATKIAKALEEIREQRKLEVVDKKDVASIGLGAIPSTGTVHGEASGHGTDGIDCPTCHGHMHKVEQNGLNIKCVGPNCGKEFVLLDKSADYKCIDCGIPIKKPEDASAIKDCPFCGGAKAKVFDWNKMRQRIANSSK